MNVTVIILGIAVVFLLFILYQYFTSKSTSLAKQTSLLTTNKLIPVTSNSAATRYALGIWVYVNSWSMNGQQKTIFSLPGKITLYLDPTSPTLYTSIGMSGGSTIIPVTQNFPIQKWTYVTISVDNTFVDCYIDGKLLKSTQLVGVQTSPTESTPTIYLGGNPASLNDITISSFYRWTNPLAPSDVWNTYMKGNGSNSITNVFNNYGLDISLLKNNVTASTYTIF
jgi:hypothetical protein